MALLPVLDVPAMARPCQLLLWNGFGFGGVNASVVFKRWTDGR